MKNPAAALLTLLAFLLSATPAAAQEVTLRVHHFMSAKSPMHVGLLIPFKREVEAASQGRIKVEVFHSMSLGGRPGDLYDQAVDGAVDIALTLPGYTAGRFNRTEVFELPFIMSNPAATAKAFWDFVAAELQNGEYAETRILAAWVHGPGVIHSKNPITRLEDVHSKELRGPTRVVTDMLGTLGAVPAGMPLPQIPENLAKGVISGALLPWSVTPSIRLSDLVPYHTEFAGARALYTATFILAMNKDSYAAMPADLQQIIDDATGKKMSETAIRVMLAADVQGRKKAPRDSLIKLDEQEAARWIAATQPVYARWINRARENGFDGQATIEKAKMLIAKNE